MWVCVQAQSEMELRVSQMSEGLRRLLEADRLPGQSLERRAGRDASESREGREGSQTLDRVAQLEQQLSSLTQQRLQHLELIQNQQMGLQARGLSSLLLIPSVLCSSLNFTNSVSFIQLEPSFGVCS